MGGHKPGVGGASLGADITFMFDSIAGTVTLAATITFESDYFSAVIKGAYSNDCKNMTQFDFVTGNATLDVDSMVVGKAGNLLRASILSTQPTLGRRAEISRMNEHSPLR